MPNGPQHKADMFTLAQDRMRAGLPSWAGRIDMRGLLHNEDMTFTQSRDAIVARLRASTWFQSKDEDDELVYLVEELADTEDTHSFNDVWDVIYDTADADRVWFITV